MKNITLFFLLYLVSFSLSSEVSAQHIFDIPIDPKEASTVFINSDKEIRVETWDETYLLFQIEIQPYTEVEGILLFLEKYKPNIIHQEFKVNDYLELTISDMDKILELNYCTPEHLISYKIIAPKCLDLELRCKNDLSVYGIHPEKYPEDSAVLKAF